MLYPLALVPLPRLCLCSLLSIDCVTPLTPLAPSSALPSFLHLAVVSALLMIPCLASLQLVMHHSYLNELGNQDKSICHLPPPPTKLSLIGGQTFSEYCPDSMGHSISLDSGPNTDPQAPRSATLPACVLPVPWLYPGSAAEAVSRLPRTGQAKPCLSN